MAKQILLDSEAIKGLKQGVDFLANSVKTTLGASGRNVMIDVPFDLPIITKDGVTVARHVELEDPLQDMGAKIVKSAAVRTNTEVGDGTTTATVLAQDIITQGFRNFSGGTNPILMKRGMDMALDVVLNNLDKIAVKSTSKNKLKSIATVSANNDEFIGDLVVETFFKVKKEGVINVEESPSGNTYTDYSSGMKFKSTLASSSFLKDKVLEKSHIKKAVVALFQGRIESKDEILPIINMAVNRKMHLLLVCNEVNPILLQSIVQTNMMGKIDITIVESPLYGDYRVQAMEDISLLTGATVFNQEHGNDLREFTDDCFGVATNVHITNETFALGNTNAPKDKVNDFVKFLQSKKKEEKDPLNIKDIEERIARFKGGISTIYVGGNSKIEIKEIIDRIEDSKNAIFAASNGGVVAGGGIALFKSRPLLDKLTSKVPAIQAGIDIVKNSLSAPLKQIILNAGGEPGEVIAKLTGKGKNYGYNVITDRIEDLMKKGIIDPKEVTKAALTSAVSVASTLLTTGCVLVDVTNFESKDINVSK